MKGLILALTCVFLVVPCHANQADLDSNGKVDLVDFSIFARAWRTQHGQPDWNPVCDISDPNDNVINECDLFVFGDNWLWSQILLEIYSDGWGTLVETATLEEEGEVTIPVYEENPYYDPPQYYVYASRNGYYTEIYYCEAFGPPFLKLITIDVDLDPAVAGKFNGVIFMTQWFFSDRALADIDVNVLDINTVVAQFCTDSQGRFTADLQPGNYDFEFISDWDEYHLEPVSIGGQYQDFFFPDHAQAFKPNIYIYPEETMELDVNIIFPHGGRITTSVPPYNTDGWHITVEPSGIIDGQYEYLFYESTQPDYGQYEVGWVVAREELEDFFRDNLAQTGFNEKEIADFVDYWVPRLLEYPYYAIYPQYNDELEEIIKLNFSARPDNLIRLIYSVRGLENNNLDIQEPVIPQFARNGFTVVEWGIILK